MNQRPMRAYLVTVQIEDERDPRVIDVRVYDGPEHEARARAEGMRIACCYAHCSDEHARLTKIEEVPNRPFTAPMGA